jgi:hypothetical protein
MECNELLLVPRWYDKIQIYFFHLVDTLMHIADNKEKDKLQRYSELLPHDAVSDMALQNKLPP